MKGPNVTLEARAMSVDDFIRLALSHRAGRSVINRTGIKGLYDFHLEYAPDETMPEFGDGGAGAPGAVPSDPVGPSIFAAFQHQLGLKLETAKGFADVLVIDQVEKPSGN